VRAIRILRAQRAFFAAARPLKLTVRQHDGYFDEVREVPALRQYFERAPEANTDRRGVSASAG
jgi:hypothetical protein